jgi:hypothetical protein
LKGEVSQKRLSSQFERFRSSLKDKRSRSSNAFNPS